MHRAEIVGEMRGGLADAQRTPVPIAHRRSVSSCTLFTKREELVRIFVGTNESLSIVISPNRCVGEESAGIAIEVIDHLT